MRILVLNNYDLDETWRKVRAGQRPDHLLYGLNYFAKTGHEIEIAPLGRAPKWSARDAWFRRHHLNFFAGSIEQQRVAWSRRGAYDLIYAPCQTQVQMLALLRYFRVFKSPLVVLVHHPYSVGKMNRLFRPYVRMVLRGIDAAPALAPDVARGIVSISNRPGHSEYIPWGPDENFYPRDASLSCHGVVAAGYSGRDFDSFIRGATQVSQVPVKILAPAGLLPQGGKNMPGHVQHFEFSQADWQFDEVRGIFQGAQAMAIPLKSTPLLSGLTSLNDALGFGKAVLMTRHSLIPLDIEKERIGWWVEPGDADGWARALALVHQHPEEVAAMGRRARALVDGGYHSRNFASRMMEIFKRAAPRRSGGSTHE